MPAGHRQRYALGQGEEDRYGDDMAVVFAYVGHNQHYPDELGYSEQFKAVVRKWRPQLVQL